MPYLSLGIFESPEDLATTTSGQSEDKLHVDVSLRSLLLTEAYCRYSATTILWNQTDPGACNFIYTRLTRLR